MFGILPHRVNRSDPSGRPDLRPLSGSTASRTASTTGDAMSTLLLLTSTTQPSVDVLPALALLPHSVKILPAEGSALLEAPASDLVLIDGRRDLAHARDLCRLIRTTGSDQPVLLVVTEGGLAVVAADWGIDDVLLVTAGPAEIDARIRMALGRLDSSRDG